MDNRPARIKKNIIAFRDSPWDVKFNFPSGYDKTNLTAYLKVGRQLLDIEVGSSISGDRFIPSLDAEQVSYLPNAVDLYIADEGVAIIAGTINVRMGGDDDDGDDGNEFEVQIGGDEIVVVEILGMDLIAGQVEIATAAAEQSEAQAVLAEAQVVLAADQVALAEAQVSLAEQHSSAAADSAISASAYATTVAADKAIVAADKATTVAAKTAAEEARDIANDAKTGAETARDVAISVSVEKIYVATYAEAVPYFTGSKSREVYVEADEAYYEGDPSWYKYDPQLGTALLGIDFNYTDE
jgi:hypothetical protein